MKQTLLKIVRFTNKVIKATQNERIHTEKLVKSNYVYNYREL